MFYIKIDPFETQNRFSFLTPDERSYLHDTLEHLKGCRGRSCTIARHTAAGSTSTMPQQEHNYTQTHRAGTKRKIDAMGN